MRRLVVLIVLVTVAAAVAFLYLRSRRGVPTAPIPALAAMAPRDARYIFYADLAALRSSDLLTQIVALFPAPAEDPDYSEFVRATGFDYSRDLDRLLVAVPPVAPTTLAIAEGRFDRDKISRYALRSGKLEKQNGADVYVVQTAKPRRTISLAILSRDRIALGTDPSLMAALAAAGPDTEMREHIVRVGGSAMFLVARMDSSPKGVALSGLRSEQLDNLLGTIRWLTLAARPEGERVLVALEAECDTAENASQLAGALEGFRFLARTALADPQTRRKLQPWATALLDQLVRSSEASQEEQRVQLRLELTSAMLRAPASPSPKSP